MKEEMELIVKICDRALDNGYIEKKHKLACIMDIERANDSFNLRLEEFLNADEYNFEHDFYGIMKHVDRRTLNKGEVLTADDWDYFVPRFAS